MAASPGTVQVEPPSSAHRALSHSPPAGAAGTNPVDLDGVGDNLYLIGRPPLRHFLRYVRSHAVEPPGDGDLTDEWQSASKLVRSLERDEAGAADNPPREKVGPEYEPLLIEFLRDPIVRNGFNTVPTEVAIVELDRLVVYQKHIDLTYARQLAALLGPAPSREQVFRTCLLHDHPQPPVKWSRVAQNRFVFLSPSNDLRFLGAMPMAPDGVQGSPRGQPVGVVGVSVGFGSNFLNALCAENRVILNNGSHRAYALRSLGVTHVPCIVQHVSSRDELDVVAPREVRRDPDLYLSHPRPPMLKDYFNPKLYRVMTVHRRLHQVIVRFEVEENVMPAP